MANEISISHSLNVNNGNVLYNQSRSFRTNQTTAKGPTVGAITVDTIGVEIVLNQITTPGVVVFTNQDSTNFVTLGVWASGFIPIFELLPGESFIMRLSRNLDTGEVAGTGTTGSLIAVADTASVSLLVEAFDK